MNADPGQAKALFLEAVENHDPEQWPAFLDHACVGQPDLRNRVEVLLAAHREAGTAQPRTSAECPAAADFDGSGPVERPGSVIGPYKLLQQIGEGGMGTVFMAEQAHPVQRKVALKLIRSGMDSAQIIARFEAERQALALMDHPNIAKVLEAGTTATGRPYFVMELVKGVPLTRYCDEHHLTPRQRLELFVPVCHAVQHAHQKGIIHRDLKPSNVMVCLYDGEPVPKVIDFGVAKAAGPKLTEKTLFTELGQVVGTLEYMSPEQAELNQLDIDTRSDIYSLGVLLYELLTGTTPLERKRFKAVAFLEVLRLIREEESPKPSTRLSTAEGLPSIAANRGLEAKQLSSLMRGELDWIVLKTLEKDRNRRYETANGLAMDIQRYLQDETVQACPPSAWYRVRKFTRRNKPALMAVGLVVLALVVGTVVSTWQALRAAAAEAQAVHDRNTANESANRANEAANRATKAVDEAKTMIEFLTIDLLGQAAPDENAPTKKITVEELLDRASRRIADGKFAGRPETEASIRLTMGNTYAKLFRLEEAENHLRRAIALRQSALGPEHVETLAAQEALAVFLCMRKRKSAEAEPLCRKTWESRIRVLGPEHRDTLDSMDTYAGALYSQGKLAEAELLLEQCWKAECRVLGVEDKNTLTTLAKLGDVLVLEGRWAEGTSLVRQCYAARCRVLGINKEPTLVSLSNLGSALLGLGELHEAETLLTDGLKVVRESRGTEHVTTAVLQRLLAQVVLEQGRRDEAEKRAREALAVLRKRLPPEHEFIGRALLVLGRTLTEKNQPGEAELLLREAIALYRAGYPDKRECIAEGESWLGACLASRGRHQEAEPLLLTSFETLKASPGVRPRQKELALDQVVNLYEAWGKPEKAAQWRAKRARP